jgi:hypothetical protein
MIALIFNNYRKAQYHLIHTGIVTAPASRDGDVQYGLGLNQGEEQQAREQNY